jgi:hypothetical protein
VDPRDEEPTGAEQVADSPRERRLELAVVILLGVAALFSAWCAYEAARFSGEQAAAFKEATRLHLDAGRSEDRAGRLIQIDVIAFMEWIDATTAGDRGRAEFFRERFRDEMKPAFEAWLASDPFDNPDAPATPFALPEYLPAGLVEARRLDRASLEASAEGEDSGSLGDKYILAVVLFAVALFQLGIQSRIGVFELRRALVVAAGAIVVGTTVWVLTLPKLWPG